MLRLTSCMKAQMALEGSAEKEDMLVTRSHDAYALSETKIGSRVMPK